MKIVTNEIKDKIIEFIMETRHGAHFEIRDTQAESLFDLDEGLVYSFLRELDALGYITKLVGYASGASAFTTTALDTFYLQGGFVKHYSIKNLLEDKLLYEVSRILETGEKAEKSEILAKVEKLRPYIDTAINLANAAVTVKSFLSGGSGTGGHG